MLEQPWVQVYLSKLCQLHPLFLVWEQTAWMLWYTLQFSSGFSCLWGNKKASDVTLLLKHSNLTMIYLNMHLRLVKSHQMKYELVVVTLDFKEDEWPGFWSYLNNSHHVILLQAHSFLNLFAGQCLWDGRYDRWASGICFAWSCSSAEAWQGLLLPHNISSHQRDI